MSGLIKRAPSGFSLALAATWLVLGACSASSSDNLFTGGGGGSNTVPEAGMADATDALFEGTIFDAGPTGDGSLTKDQACAGERFGAEVVPLDLYIMADRSSSMSGSAWTEQSAALNSFFNDSQSTGLYIALHFFPLDGSCTSQDPSCSGDAYVKPLVDWGVLPGHAGALAAAVSATSPDGCTPTQEALNGALRGAQIRQNAQPDHVVAAVMVSDGDPCCSMCPVEEASGIGGIAAQFANDTPPIRTFSIFVDDSATDVMTAIASQGGTGQAFDATSGQQAFITALEDIRGAILGCEYKIPVPEQGTVNPDLIEIEFTTEPGQDPITLDRKDSKSECIGGGGWYYDDNDNPSKIILCTSTCAEVQDQEGGVLDIIVGCTGTAR